MLPDQNRIARWYFGGVASSMATMVTHPLDLLKVVLQTQETKVSLIPLTRKIIQDNGFLSLYNGISASLLRQYTYTLSRFGIYTVGKNNIDISSMFSKVCLAGVSGFLGGIIGSPGDLVNVRLQNDMRLPPAERRNYKHVFDGIFRVCKEEGWTTLFNGSSTNAFRGMLMTIGQIAFYEQTKTMMVNAGFPDSTATYIIASIVSASAATVLTQPLDVVKTRTMNAKAGQYSGIHEVVIKTAKEGPLAFFKGSVPTFLRLGPHTVLLFLGLEFLRTHFGYLPEEKK